MTFCGAGNGYVTTWYDQSGNGIDITNATAANTVAVGNKITLVISAPTNLDNLQATLKTTRT